MKKVITVTGITGAGSREFANSYKELMDPSSVGVELYHTGTMIYDEVNNNPSRPPISKDNLLDLNPNYLNSKRDHVFERIIREIEESRRERIVVDTHAQFLWNNIYTNAFDWRHIKEIDSDLYINIIDKPSTVKENQMNYEGRRIQDHTLIDLLSWMNIEANVTIGWAENMMKPWYVLPSKQDPLTIESLLDNSFLIYFQMPMTEANSDQDREITAFKEKLLDVGRKLTGKPTPLIDPRDIDIETGEGLDPRTRDAIRDHCVYRDMDWYIAEATDQVAFYPKGTPISKGVTDETTRGYESGKNTFVIFQKDNTSPFFEIAKKVFESEKAFFEFFPGYMERRLEFYRRERWQR